MGIMRKAIFNRLNEEIGNEIPCYETYGYITKSTRTSHGLPKAHTIDARCISGNPCACSDGKYWIIRKLRANNRQLHRATINKGGKRRNNQAPREVRGFRLMDSVEYAYRDCFLSGRRLSGKFSVADITGKVLADSVSYRKLTLKHHNNTYIMEEAVLLSPTKDG
jgi:N6-L-threonylcarbamoyladenine synthase